MAWYPGVLKRKLRFADSMATRQNSATVVFHTNDGGTDNGDLFGWFNRSDNTDHVASHFQVAKDGRLFQYIDTARKANAQYDGNDFAVSIETEDDGNPNTPWTQAQLNTILKVLEWLKVPAKVSPDGPGGGIGWHSLYSNWNKSNHNCPGSVREGQIKNYIIPKLKEYYAGGDDVVTSADKDDIAKRVLKLLRQTDNFPAPAGSPSHKTNPTWVFDSAIAGILNKLYEHDTVLAEIKKKVGA